MAVCVDQFVNSVKFSITSWTNYFIISFLLVIACCKSTAPYNYCLLSVIADTVLDDSNCIAWAVQLLARRYSGKDFLVTRTVQLFVTRVALLKRPNLSFYVGRFLYRRIFKHWYVFFFHMLVAWFFLSIVQFLPDFTVNELWEKCFGLYKGIRPAYCIYQ